MIKYLLVILCGLLLAYPAMADLMSTRPDPGTVRAATAECRTTSRSPARGIVGISDPHARDPGVIDLIADTGVKWVRAEFHWSLIQPKPGGTYQWGSYDRMVQAYNARGINVLGIMTYIPQALPKDWGVIDAEFSKFSRAVVRRYAAQGVHYWEVFNEPNLTGYGWLSDKEPAEPYLGAYTLLLARANEAVRAIDPNGFVVLGGIAADSRRTLPPESTMKTLFSLGAGRCFDIFAFHPYGYQNRFPEARQRVDRILAAGGAGEKPVWFNEYGWTGQNEMALNVNNTKDTNPMMAVFSQRGAADALFWFAAKDYSNRRRAPKFGLADFNLNRRPSFETFRRLVNE